MSSNRPLMVSAALPYANGPIHIGHVAGCYLPADMWVRYSRLTGRDVVFVSGTDEHGVPIMLRAREEGKSPQDIADFYYESSKKAFEGFGMSFDYYGRTSSQLHHKTSQEFFKVLLGKNGVLEKKTTTQLYDPEAKIFLADRFVKGECPNCQNPDAWGDQCENCGTTLSPSELKNPRSTITDVAPIEKETSHWYLKLGDLQKDLETWLGDMSDWKVNVKGQVKSWLNDGLRDRAITRDIDWGVPLPKEAGSSEEIERKVLYVWFDAPIGYLSFTKEWAVQQGDPDLWKKYWLKTHDAELVHFLGKDNIVFHSLLFPAMLQSHGDFVLPSAVPANEFLNLQGQKLSTSKNWAVWLNDYLELFPPDFLRYAMAATLPETKDSDFDWNDFQARVNSELADILGNFVNRTITFCNRFFDGIVPELSSPSDLDKEVLAELAAAPDRVATAYGSFKLREAVFESMKVARVGNKYFNDTEPWKSVKEQKELCANTIHICLQLCASLSILMDPIIPTTCQKIRDMLNLPLEVNSLPGDSGADDIWSLAKTSLLSSGHKVDKAEILFTKIEDETIQEQIDKLGPAVTQVGPPIKDEIEYDDFAKLDFRVGEILEVHDVPKADKLLRLIIDIGGPARQILAGIKEHVSDPQALIGKKVVVVANLKPRKLRGFMSEGMVLAAEDDENQLTILHPDAKPGAEVR